MLVYPQLITGALSQFPVQKRRRLRTVVNTSLDGRPIKLADPGAEITEWQLAYTGLTDDEVAALQQFFLAVEGTLNTFTFLDPTANLFAWSDHLSNAAWAKGPLLSITGGIADPAGGTNAWHLTDSGAGAQNISQTLSAPAGYLYCFSVFARALEPTSVTLLHGSNRANRILGANWSRITLTDSGDASAESIAFGVELPAGGSADVFGLQVEPQAGASAYKATTTGGVYENARFRDDVLSITTTGVNCHSATVNIIHANHL
ncbi:MAG: hypothetical protein ABSH44_04410 [Bryobacteraceae bacterium]|jgi:hypothetical protein